jgi:hypothetical protein
MNRLWFRIEERPVLWTWRRLHEMTVPMKLGYLIEVNLN